MSLKMDLTPAAPSTAFDSDAVYLVELVGSDGRYFTMTITERDAGRIRVQRDFGLPPDGDYHVRISNAASWATALFETGQPVAVTTSTIVGRFAVPLSVIFATSFTYHGGPVTISATGMGVWTFGPNEHKPYLDSPRNPQTALTGVSGWGTNMLMATMPTGIQYGPSHIEQGSHVRLVPDKKCTLVLQPARQPLDVTILPTVLRKNTQFFLEVTRFQCVHQTYDDSREFDGKGDEVFFVGASHRRTSADDTENVYIKSSTVYGDTNNQAGREKAGELSDRGGIGTGHEHHLSRPFPVWSGWLKQPDQAVLVAPMIYEKDAGGQHHIPAGDFEFATQMRELSAEWLPDTDARVGVTPGGLARTLADPQTAIIKAGEVGPVIRRPHVDGDRPIGAQRENEGKTQAYRAKVIALTHTLASVLAVPNQDGKPIEIEVEYREPKDWLDGHYKFWLAVRKGAETEELIPPKAGFTPTIRTRLPSGGGLVPDGLPPGSADPTETVDDLIVGLPPIGRTRIDLTLIPEKAPAMPWQLEPRTHPWTNSLFKVITMEPTLPWDTMEPTLPWEPIKPR